MNKLRIIPLTLILLLIPTSVSAMSAGELFNGVNSVREYMDLPRLTNNSQLDTSALLKAKDMCEKDYWGHGPWEGFIKASGYPYLTAGENLAYGFSDVGSVINGWINSPGHYANMVGDYNEGGMAVVTCLNYQGKTNQVIVVNHFGKQASQPVNPTPKPTPPKPQPKPQVEPLAPPEIKVEIKEPERDGLFDLLNTMLKCPSYLIVKDEVRCMKYPTGPAPSITWSGPRQSI